MCNPPRSIPRIISNTYLDDYEHYRVILVGVGVNIIGGGDCLRFQTCVGTCNLTKKSDIAELQQKNGKI